MEYGLTISEATELDAEAVARLCRASLAPADSSDEPGLRRLLWRDPNSSASLQLRAMAGSDLVGCIFGSVTNYGSDGVPSGFVKLVAVRPDARRRGVGSLLLAELERNLAAIGAGSVWAGGSQPRYWWAGVDQQHTDACGFFAAAGFGDIEHVSNMLVDLSGPQAARVLPAAAVVPRRLTSDEWPQFKTWLEDSWGRAWQEEVELTLDREPVSCFVASEHGSYMGFAAYDTNRLGWFGPMGSSPESRGRGVGHLLLSRCLNDFTSKGRSECEISWIGPEDFYRRTVGAVLGRRFIRFRKAAATTPD
jgi:mycothiol synthase